MKYKTKMKLVRLRRKFIRPVQFYLRRHKIAVLVFVLSFVIGVLLGKLIFTPEPPMLDPRGCEWVSLSVQTTLPAPTPTKIPAKLPVKPIKAVSPQLKTWTGMASYYSREGCVGCSKNLHMANGQDLVDENLTVAFNKLKLGSKVRVTNLKSGQSVVATVTDTGGFERLNRIIDLTIGTRNAISCSNLCQVKVEEIKLKNL